MILHKNINEFSNSTVNRRRLAFERSNNIHLHN